MIEHRKNAVTVQKQCELLSVARSSLYYKHVTTTDDAATVLNEVSQIYQECPFYGYRRMLVELRKRSFVINHKRLQRILCTAGMKAIYPGKKTTIRKQSHKVYPYLLRNVTIGCPNQA